MTAERLRAKLMADPTMYAPGTLDRDPKDGRIGSIKGIEVGDTWPNRQKMSDAGVHTSVFAGIAGNTKQGASSIVVSGKYEDDKDFGETILYTGTGGRGTTGKSAFGGDGPQTEDQTFGHSDNRALQVSRERGTPVRVIRAIRDDNGRLKEYRYDGLYDVKSADLAKGLSGYRICQFRMQRKDGQKPLPT